MHLVFVYCEKRKLNISSVVMAGSKAQAKAFNCAYPRSLWKIHFTTDTAKKVRTFPRACHLIENAHKRLLQTNNDAGGIGSTCRFIGRMLNELPTSLAACPMFVSTRWIDDYDIVQHPSRHRKDAAKAMQQPVPSDDELGIL